MYLLRLQVVRPLCLVVHQNDNAWCWQERLGHVNFRAMEMGRLEMVCRLSGIDHVEQFCSTCILIKNCCDTFMKQSKYHADKLLELVHSDLGGPIRTSTPGGRCFFLLLIDDVTYYMWVVLLAAKSDASNAIKHIQAAVESECGRKLWELRTGIGGEFTGVEFIAYCDNEGVLRHFSVPFSSQ
jgi:hypothetical protein